MGDGPRPFSSVWLQHPTPPTEPPRRFPRDASRRLLRFARYLPGERVLSVLMVVLLILVSLGLGGPNGENQTARDESGSGEALANAPSLRFADPLPTQEPAISTESLAMADEAEQPRQAPSLNLVPPEEQTNTAGGLLPEHRLLTYYGFPGNDQMGILGEYDKDELLELLQETAAAYENADPSRPVLIGFEVIASVAQGEPQADGSYLMDTPSSVLDEYAEFTAENDILLFLDVQFGTRTVEEELEPLRPWLTQEHVHLALDPEFAVRDGQTPGLDIGQIDGEDVTFAQNWLVDLAEEHDLPPKVLIVHQFTLGMIENKDVIEPVKGVQLIIDSDGWGAPENKRVTYATTNSNHPIEFDGIKLFYQQDVPLMTPEEVLQLDPIPDLVIYQ